MKMNEQKPKTENHSHNLTERVMGKIESGDTKLRPRSYFATRNYLMWSLAVAAILLGALAVSSVIFRVSNFHLITPRGVEDLSDLENVWELLPLIWLVAFTLFGYLAYEEIRATRQGYKYELSTLLLVMVVSSGVLGVAFYSVGSGYVLDKMASRYVPFHPDIEVLRERVWQQPQGGFVSGEVVELTPEGFILTGPESSLWQVEYGDWLSEEEKALIEVGKRVGVIGGFLEEGEEFIACALKPLEVRGRGPMMVRSEPESLREELRERIGERNDELLRIKDCRDARNLEIINNK